MDPSDQMKQQIEAANRAARKRVGMKSEDSFIQRVPKCFSVDEMRDLRALADREANPS